MNEQIQELAEQAGIVFWEMSGDVDWRQANKETLEKFAKLIVQECALTIQDFVDHRFPASEYPTRLKKYFGVED